MDRIHQIASGYVGAKLLLAAAELGLFDRLLDGPASVEQLAGSCGGRPGALRILLGALVALEVLELTDGRYSLPEELRQAFAAGGAAQLSLLRHRNRLFRHWAFLEQIVRGEALPREIAGDSVHTDAEANEDFIRAMYAVSGGSAASVVERIDLTGVERVADLGGGPGHYLSEFCRRLPRAEAYLVDLPLTLSVARKMLAERGEGERWRLLEWDIYAEEPPAELPQLDLAFLSQVAHGRSAEDNQRLVRRVADRLRPGGRLVIHENAIDPDGTSPPEAALFSVNMLVMTDGGRCYTADEMGGWGEAAGLELAGGERISERSFLLTLRRPAAEAS